MNDLFLRACRREPVERSPVWMMRQAGRSLPEYRALRERHDFLTLCRTPELAAEVTLQPVRRLGVDAAILFSDILIPAEPMGFRFDFAPGPVLEAPVRCAADVDRIRDADPEESVPFVYDTLRLLRQELRDEVPVIGFAASPFTLAVYLVEGGGSKHHDKILSLIYGDPKTAHRLLDKVTATTERYLVAQARAGAQALQLFDSWAGLLDRKTYREFALPYAQRVLQTLRDEGVPRIYFALNAGHLLEEIRDCGADVVGVDWRTSLAEASEQLDHRFVLQGNLDPCVLLAPGDVIERRATEILHEAARLPGHVFNLGHGVLPNTPVDNLMRLVATVRAAKAPDRQGA